MRKRIGSYPHIRVEGGGRGVASQAGSVLLVETIRKAGLDQAISAALAPWRKQRAIHDPGRVLLDVALAVALGGDCLTGWPKGVRLTVREERPHSGAQLRFTDTDGMRLTCFAINTQHTPIAELELRPPPTRPRRGPHPRHRSAQQTGTARQLN